MNVQELNHVALHVRNLTISKQFYQNILGLEPLPRPNFSFEGAWYALGSQELHLIVEETFKELELTPGHFALRVENIVTIQQELLSHGVTDIKGPAPRPDGALQIFLTDPDGHVIELLDMGPLL